MKRILVAATVGAAAMLVGACGSSTELKGTMSLTYGSWGGGANCYGVGGYSDIAPGTPVTVYSGNEIVAMGSLGQGRGDIDATGAAASDSALCVLPFTIPDVSIDGDFLEIEVGNRGRVPFSKADAEAASLDVVLGD